ncbi:MAG: hypothetical protein KTR31_17410 [Myxococcales bacterium]|nr:hypothetical protein [Myxococcales bacterium]
MTRSHWIRPMDPLCEPLRIIGRYESVHIVTGHRVVVLDGLRARLITELGQIGRPAPWRAVARELWRREQDQILLRRRFDRLLARTRSKLRTSRVRQDLVRPTGTGSIELFLLGADSFEDQT